MRKISLYLSLIFSLFFLAPVGAQTVLLAGDYPDPTILKDGEDYYMTHSPLFYKPGFLIWHSRDLVNWEPYCRAEVDWKGSAWAPDLQKVGDTYYIYFPAEGGNWVTTAKDIRGPWTEPVNTDIGGIDPGLCITPDGKRYLFTNGGQVTPLTADGLHRAGQTENVYLGWQYPQEWQTECMCLESPKLTYHDGWYYMTSAEGGTAGPATSHMAVCARSRSVMGPWEDSPYNPIVHTYSAAEQWWSKGHGTIVEGPDGQWWIVYHAYNKDAYSLGRYTLMEPIEWTKGGWYRPVKDYESEEYRMKSGAWKMLFLSDDFSKPTLGWQWTGWKEDISKVVKLKKGVLIMPGRGTTPQDARLMTTIATDVEYAIETEVTVGKKDNQAGLLLYYCEKAFAGLTTDGKTFAIYKSATEKEEQPNTLGRTLRIRLLNHASTLDILVSHNGTDWQALAQGVNIADFHHNRLGDFLALRPALCSMGSGEAQFRDFQYVKYQ